MDLQKSTAYNLGLQIGCKFYLVTKKLSTTTNFSETD